MKVKKVYDTVGLVNELQGLEYQFQKLNDKVHFLQFYNSLLNRITEYAENLEDTVNTRQYRKVLSYLYTAILGRINDLTVTSETSLILDISKYLQSFKKNIMYLKELKKDKKKFTEINNKLRKVITLKKIITII